MPEAVTHILIPILLVALFRDFYWKKRNKGKNNFPLHYVLIAGLGGKTKHHVFLAVMGGADNLFSRLRAYLLPQNVLQKSHPYITPAFAKRELNKLRQSEHPRFNEVVSELRNYLQEGVAVEYTGRILQDLQAGMYNLEQMVESNKKKPN